MFVLSKKCSISCEDFNNVFVILRRPSDPHDDKGRAEGDDAGERGSGGRRINVDLSRVNLSTSATVSVSSECSTEDPPLTLRSSRRRGCDSNTLHEGRTGFAQRKVDSITQLIPAIF